MKKPAEVTLRVFGSGGGKPVREVQGGAFRPGDNQIFYNGLDSQDKPLPPSSYIYELYAADSEFKATRQESMTRASDKQH